LRQFCHAIDINQFRFISEITNKQAHSITQTIGTSIAFYLHSIDTLTKQCAGIRINDRYDEAMNSNKRIPISLFILTRALSGKTVQAMTEQVFKVFLWCVLWGEPSPRFFRLDMQA
jgi:hypothetical protein